MGQPQSIEISGDDNIVPFIITDVRDGTLVIKTDHRGRMRPKERLMVTIVTPELQRLDVSGACDVEVEGLEAGEFNVDISGASQVAAKRSLRSARRGDLGRVRAQAVGDGSRVRQDRRERSVGRKVMATDYLIADASGASTIRYAGDPGSVKVDKSGASSIKAIRVASEE